MAEYTKGEWEAKPSLLEPGRWILYGKTAHEIFHLATINNEPDANLIAAAPDMHEALKEAKVLLNIEGYDENSIVVGMIDKALTKANGGK